MKRKQAYVIQSSPNLFCIKHQSNQSTRIWLTKYLRGLSPAFPQKRSRSHYLQNGKHAVTNWSASPDKLAHVFAYMCACACACTCVRIN